MRALLFSILFLFSISGFAASFSLDSASGLVRVEPVFGYEMAQKIYPTPHVSSRFFYGLRLRVGQPILAVEAEVQQARETENFPAESMEVKEESTTGRLGLSSTIALAPFVAFYLRAGGQAKKSKYTITEDGVTETKEPAVKIFPYAGSGLTVSILKIFSLNAGITAVFTDQKQVNNGVEYQGSLGWSFRI